MFDFFDEGANSTALELPHDDHGPVHHDYRDGHYDYRRSYYDFRVSVPSSFGDKASGSSEEGDGTDK